MGVLERGFLRQVAGSSTRKVKPNVIEICS